MQKSMVLVGFSLILLAGLVACSNDNEEDDALVIEADSKREDVKTEADIFDDVMHYLDDYYFPTKVNHANDTWFRYDVEAEEISLAMDYHLWKLEKEEDSAIPSSIDITIQSEDDDTSITLDEKGRHFAIDNLDGYVQDHNGNLYYSGENTDTGDLYAYNMGDVFLADAYDAIVEAGLKNNLSKDYGKGYSFLSEWMNIPLEDLDFLAIEETNFDIVNISMNYMKGNDETDESPLHQSVHITYQYNNYKIFLTIHNGNISSGNPVKWTDDDREWFYTLTGEQKMKDKPDRTMKKEELEGIKELMTRKVKDE